MDKQTPLNGPRSLCVYVFTCVHVYKTVIIIEETMNLRVSGGSWTGEGGMKGWKRCKYSVLKYKILKKKES